MSNLSLPALNFLKATAAPSGHERETQVKTGETEKDRKKGRDKENSLKVQKGREGKEEGCRL